MSTSMPSSARRRALVAWLCLCTCCAACGPTETEKLTRALVGRGRVAVLGRDDLTSLRVPSAELLPAAKQPEVTAALAGDAPVRLVEALHAGRLQGVLVRTDPGSPPSSLTARLARYDRLPGLRGVYLSPGVALYELDPVRDWSPSLRAGIAEVARRLIGGAAPPHLRSFPEIVRRMEPAEVMVLLRSGSRARLWRSARGSSFARALLTACDVARQRWIEREQAMGGPLDRSLPRLQVEVSLLQDDGELGAVDESFVNRAVSKQHGVAYEHKGSWRYMLPEATHARDIPSPYRAFARLFAEDGLPEDSLRSQELRPYRVAVQVIGISAARKPKNDDPSEVESPAEVLGP